MQTFIRPQSILLGGKISLRIFRVRYVTEKILTYLPMNFHNALSQFGLDLPTIGALLNY